MELTSEAGQRSVSGQGRDGLKGLWGGTIHIKKRKGWSDGEEREDGGTKREREAGVRPQLHSITHRAGPPRFLPHSLSSPPASRYFLLSRCHSSSHSSSLLRVHRCNRCELATHPVSTTTKSMTFHPFLRRSDSGVLSPSGRCCSRARTMQLAMMVARIIHSNGVRRRETLGLYCTC
ncbi:hypothetical protein EYF80_006467 [Liparis tanakae]|uniref:Uncharacterized protein n=1 Tax=Liparis tanakae TaxID=230148 RepID=A0A4Z2IZZ6_9TELE|nr:hypothetical protein EYF80_006467 [Liparis tanakae]